MTDAAIGYGVQFKMRTSTGPDVYTTIGEQSAVTPPGETIDSVDASHTQSPNQMREYIPGMGELTEASITINYVPGGTAEATLRAAKFQTKRCRTVFPSGAYAEYDAFITEISRETPIDDKMSAEITYKCTGDMEVSAAAAPANTVLPAISGTLTVGQTLTAFEGVWSGEPTSFSYQWKNEGSNIAGATAKTYTLVAGDSGDNITVAVTATNSAGSATATSSATDAVGA